MDQTAAETVTVRTTRFGDLEVPRDEVLAFPEGILGFETVREYVLLDPPDGGPLRWLQAVDVPRLAFIVCEPQVFVPEYRIRVRREELAAIELTGVEDGHVLAILVVPDDPRRTTANLQGPIVLNRTRRLAKQLVLPEGTWSTRHPIFPS